MKLPEKALWISHRGESHDAPENTLAAFRTAREKGSDGSECDVRLSTDGKVYVYHDSRTVRMCDGILDLDKGASWEELSRLSIADCHPEFTPQRIPLFSETVAELGEGRVFFVELKGSDLNLVPAVKEEVLRTGLTPAQCIFIAFDEAMIAAIKKAMPEYDALWLMNIATWESMDALMEHLRELGVDGIDSNYYDVDATLPEKIARLHEAGFGVGFWTVDNPAIAEFLLDSGADYITSNCASTLRKAVKR